MLNKIKQNPLVDGEKGLNALKVAKKIQEVV